MGAPYKPRPMGSLKQAIALLVQCCGGQTAVASMWNCSPQNVARMTDDAHAKAWPRIDQIAQLETLCKDPIVTRQMAADRSCIVEPMLSCSHEPLAIVMGRITSEMGELLSAAALDVQNGKLTRANAANVLRETDELVCAVLELRGGCRAVLESGAA